jgi:hypothetical protein
LERAAGDFENGIGSNNIPGREHMKAKKKNAAPTVKLKMGDMVAWKSQANGFVSSKKGEIVAIVRPGNLPAARFGDIRSRGKARTMVSYVVRVERIGDSDGGKNYWPRTCHLQKV